MILCLLGTNPYDFSRLVRAVDEQLGPHYEVVIQKGNTFYKTINSKSFDFCSRQKLTELIKNSELLITQGGYGSMMDGITLGKKIVAVPRQITLKECLDDQFELVNYYHKKGYVVKCEDTNLLEKVVLKCFNEDIVFTPFLPESSTKINEIINDYLRFL